jgi:two-component system response regulator AtoC
MRTELNSQVILLVEDESEVRNYIEMALRCDGFSVETAKDGEEGLNSLQMGLSVSAVLLDVSIPDRDGLEVLREIRDMGRNLPVIVISDTSSSGVIVQAMRAGANDFLGKPVSHESLRRALNNVFGESVPETPKLTPVNSSAELFFGSSPSMQALRNVVPLVAFSEAPVLIQGETGVGKEVLARYLHSFSQRARKPFIKLNCAALPSELVESELFGYERGAFTGAYQRKPGMFEIADGGTLLLDEIGDMDFKLQAKLLQVLQDHEFQRLGGKETVRVDVRVVAATHSDLEKSIAAGSFRQDLYYRLNVVSLYVPPLRELRDDIIPLAKFLVKKYCSDPTWEPEITLELKRALLTHDWPGNVRELDNVVRKFAVLRDPDAIVRDLRTRATRRTFIGPSVLEQKPTPAAAAPPILDQVTQSKNQAEAEAIMAALSSTRWNRKKASALLRIDYKALLYKMKKLGIDGNAPAENGMARAIDEEPFSQIQTLCPTCKNALPASSAVAQRD